MVCYALLQRLLARVSRAADQQALHNTLLKALPDLVSGVPPLDLWTSVAHDRGRSRLHALFDHGSAGARARRDRRRPWLPRSRVRSSGSSRLGLPLLRRADADGARASRSEPARVIDLIKAMSRSTASPRGDLLDRQAPSGRENARRVMTALGVNRPCRHRRSRRCGGPQRSILLRERARLKQALLYSRLRRIALAIGDRLVAAGHIDAPTICSS